MGNPNVLWWRWALTRSVGAGGTVVSPPERFLGYSFQSTGAHGIILGGKGADTIEIHELRMREIGTGFPNSFPPLINIDFEINDVVYYRKVWQSRQTPPFLVDLNVVNSNTQGSPSGDAPLILSGGETIRIKTTDVMRPNNFDTYDIQVDLWGIRI